MVQSYRYSGTSILTHMYCSTLSIQCKSGLGEKYTMKRIYCLKFPCVLRHEFAGTAIPFSDCDARIPEAAESQGLAVWPSCMLTHGCCLPSL